MKDEKLFKKLSKVFEDLYQIGENEFGELEVSSGEDYFTIMNNPHKEIKWFHKSKRFPPPKEDPVYIPLPSRHYRKTPTLESLGIDEVRLWNKHLTYLWIAMDGDGSLFGYIGKPMHDKDDTDDTDDTDEQCWHSANDDYVFRPIEVDVKRDKMEGVDWKVCLWKRPQELLLKIRIDKINTKYSMNLNFNVLPKITGKGPPKTELFLDDKLIYVTDIMFMQSVLDGIEVQYTHNIIDNKSNIYYATTPTLESLGIDESKIWGEYKKAKWLVMNKDWSITLFTGFEPPIISHLDDVIWFDNNRDDTSCWHVDLFNYTLMPKNINWKKCLWKRPEDNK